MIRYLFLLLLMGSSAAMAQAYPSKTVKFVMPAAAGSSPDRVSRLLAEKLGVLWNAPVIVENRPGATGTVGSEYVMRSAPDGHTALFAFTSVIQAPALMPKVPYDIEKDFAAVSLVAYAAVALAVRADSPYRTLADLLAAARNPAAPLAYGTFGAGSTYHIYGETLARAAKAHMVMVPYKGEALAMTDLLGGQIPSTWASIGLASPHVQSGRVRALAVAHTRRSPALPDVPTFTELGYPQLGTVSWFGVLVPAATPRAVVEKLSADINRVMALPEVAEPLARIGIEPAGTTPERFAEVLRVDAPKWRQMIQDAGITASN
ncbi:MAG TPA: tripartite tricarboxylate transporter substrate binding protein [Burkholderiales bacterium]|nr:tripartite tricarboxylate transporter substrate binding protein [Burkholderiales bacterium]